MKKFLTALFALCITASMSGCSPEPKTPLEEKIMEEYVKSMDMDIKVTQVSNSIYKTEDCSNPISPTIFCADPTAVEYEGRLVKSVKTEEAGAWIYVKGVDFGDKKAEVFYAIVKGKGKIQAHADQMGTDPIAVLEFDNNEYLGVYNKTTEKLEGVHDIYIMISDPDVYIDSWGFASM